MHRFPPERHGAGEHDLEIEESHEEYDPTAEPARWPGRTTLTALTAGPAAARVDRRAKGAGTPGKVSRVALEALRRGSSGRPLPRDLEQRLEQRLDTDLSDVRVHTGPEAEAAATALHAEAFAFGPDIYFGRGAYDPASDAGRRLIAHEVAHTLQAQGAGASDEIDVSSPHDTHEREADEIADRFVRPEAATEREAARRILTPDEGPRLVRPATLLARPAAGRLSRNLLTDENGEDLTATTIHPPDIRLFDPVNVFKYWNPVDLDIPLVEGVFMLGMVPIDYGASLGLNAYSWLAADLGPGMLEGIEVDLGVLGAADRILPDGLTIGGIPSWGDVRRWCIGPHSASATAAVGGSGSAGIVANAQANVSVGVLDMFKIGAYGGLVGSAHASFDVPRAEHAVDFKWDDGVAKLGSVTLSGELDVAWKLKLEAFLGLYIDLDLMPIKIVDDALAVISDLPFFWWVPEPEDLEYHQKWQQNWKLAEAAGQRSWKKRWTIVAAGSSPGMTASGAVDEDEFDLGAVVKEMIATTPEDPIPPGHEGPGDKKTHGTSHGDMMARRLSAKAQVESVKRAAQRERAWNDAAIGRAAKAIAAAPAEGGAPAAEAQVKELEERKTKLDRATAQADEMEGRVDSVKSLEAAKDGPTRNQALRVYQAIDHNANLLGEAVAGYGKGDEEAEGEFERVEEEGAKEKGDPAAAEAARDEVDSILDPLLDWIDEEVAWVAEQYEACGSLDDFAEYRDKVEAYERVVQKIDKRASDIENRVLKVAIEEEHATDYDEQLRVYTDAKRDLPEIEADLGKLKRPGGDWDNRFVIVEDRVLRLRHEYRKVVRLTFYSGFWTDTFDWKDLIVTRWEAPHLADKPGEDFWYFPDEVSPSRGDHWWSKTIAREKPSIDHHPKACVDHWNEEGHDQGWDERALFYNGYNEYDKHLRVLPVGLNSSEGAKMEENFQPEVTKKFRGKNSEKGGGE